MKMMNIVYISYLKNIKTHGPFYSVPAQITAQSKYDSVFWYNVSDAIQEQWINTGLFHGIKEYPSCRIVDLPFPFNKPDIVIFESYYIKEFIKLGRELYNMNIPYIIIPRGAFSKGAQKKKAFKKKLGNLLFFKNLAKRARAIQYLTIDEYKDSGDSWNKNFLIIPNGIAQKDNPKIITNGLIGCFIGRIDPYHKGLDIMIDACSELQDEMRASGCVINLYGPERLGCKAVIEKTINDKKINDLMILHEGVFDIEKENVLIKSDFFIMTSRFEGHPMGLIEALSYGLPCFVTKGTNMSNEIKEYDAGWTADNNSKSVIESMQILIKEKNLFSKKGNNAFILARNYNWDSIAQKCHQEYLILLNNN